VYKQHILLLLTYINKVITQKVNNILLFKKIILFGFINFFYESKSSIPNIRLNYFLLLFLRVAPNQLGLKAGPKGAKAHKAVKVPHSALTCQNRCSHSSLFSP